MIRANSSHAALREQLLSAAAEQFASKGIDAVSLSDVASAAGTSAASAYRHFASKDDLITETMVYVVTHRGAEPKPRDLDEWIERIARDPSLRKIVVHALRLGQVASTSPTEAPTPASTRGMFRGSMSMADDFADDEDEMAELFGIE